AVAVLYPDDGVIRILNPEGNQLWQQGRDGIAGGVEAADQFGYAVAAGDFNKDGSADIVVGVKNENSHAGAVNVIYGTPVPTPFEDRTPPSISFHVDGARPLAGWFTSDAAVTWTGPDPESSIRSTAGCGPVSI